MIVTPFRPLSGLVNLGYRDSGMTTKLKIIYAALAVFMLAFLAALSPKYWWVFLIVGIVSLASAWKNDRPGK